MQLFKLRSRLHEFARFADFADEFRLNERDLVITNVFLYDPFMKPLGLKCHFVMQEQYGQGEPSDEMMNAILRDVKPLSFDRVIAIGGGTAVTHSIKESGTHYASIYPMQTFREWTRNAVHLNHLNEMHKRLKALEAQLAERNGNEE